MEDQKKHIDDLFRKELNDYQEAPGSGMWDRIEGNLNRIDNKARPGNNPKGGKGLLGYSVGLILIAATAFFMYSHFADHTASQAPLALSSKDIAEGNKKDIATVTAPATNSNVEQNIAGKTSSAQQAVSVNGKGSSANAATVNNNTSASLLHPAKSHAHTAYRVAKNKSAYKTHSGIAAVTSPAAKHHSLSAKATPASDAAITKSTTNNTAATENKNPDGTLAAIPTNTDNKSRHQSATQTKRAIKSAATSDIVDAMASKEPAKAKTIKKQNHQIAETKADETVNKQDNVLAASVNTSKVTTKKTNIKNGSVANNESRKKRTSTTKVTTRTTTTATDATADAKQKTEAAKKIIPAATAPAKAADATKPSEVAIAKEKDELKPTQELAQAPKATDENTSAKATPGDNSSAASKDNAAADQLKNPFSRSFTLDAGARLGYEKGFGSYSGNKATAAVYVEVKLSDNFGLLIQPAIKYTHLNNEINYGTKSYYNNTGKHVDSTPASTGAVFNYSYYGLYDSILVKSRTVNTSYLAFEVPILLRYRLSNAFSILGGVNFDIGHIFAVQDDQVNIHLKTSTTKMPTVLQPSEFDSLYNNVVYSHPGTSYSSYTPSATSASQSSLRIGYMLGVDYSFAERFSLQFIMSQALTGLGNITDQNIKGIYSQPYFRLSIGYRFLNLTTKKTPYNGGL